jgi:signal transduction histidine kinase/CheY-like chemotaxis protein
VPSLHERREAPQGKLLTLASALTDASHRAAAARELAAFVGAEDLIVFMPDREVGALLPAPGFAQTLPDSAAWRDLLSACVSHGSASATLPVPGFPGKAVVRAVAGERGAVVALAGGNPAADRAADLALLLPLITSAFAGEITALAAEGHAAVARETASQASLLATSLDQARRALQKALAEAKSANDAKDHFLAVLSHELRTPLTPILVTASLLESDPRFPEDLLPDLQSIRRNAALETRLIDDLLDVTRITNGKLELQQSEVRVNRLLDQTLEMYRAEMHQKDLALTTRWNAVSDAVAGDAARLQQVFWNLIKNAVKFTPESGRITVETRNEPDGRIRIDVRDTGIGIEPSNVTRVFNAFDQGDRSVVRRFGGLGLGLSISRALVELHGGTIEAASEGAGRGTAFTVRLPVARFAEHRPPRPQPAAPSEADERKLRILLVEDHEATSRVMTRLLKSFGHDVSAAGSVAAARKAAALEDFDLLISDLGLPDGTGLELMRELRQHGPVRGIALTGYGTEEDLKLTADAGFAEHLTKPIEPGRLKEAIDRLA